jgi:hypothetical protein
MKFQSRYNVQCGNTLAITLLTMATVGVLVGLSLEYTNSIGRNVQRSLLLRQATNIGDASTEWLSPPACYLSDEPDQDLQAK